MAVVEIADAKGEIQKIDVQTSGEGLEQLVADLAVKGAVEALHGLLEGNAVVKVTDNAGSLTVDAPLATPVGVRLSDGTSALATTAGRLQIDDGGQSVTVDSPALGTEGEAEATGNGGIVGLLKRLRKLLEGSGSIGLAAGSNSIGTVVLGAGTAEAGKVKVTELPAVVLAAGTNAIGKLAANAGVNIGNVGLAAASHEGVESKLVISAASTNSTLVKSSAGKVFGWHIANKEAAWIYVKIYAKATAPTVGTDTQVMVIPIPAGGAANVEFANGITVPTGIGLGITKGAANGNTEAVASEGVIVNLLFK